MSWLGRGFGFALVTAYIPGIYQAPSAGKWAVAALGLAALLWVADWREYRLSFGGLLLGLVGVSLLSVPHSADGANELWQMALLAAAFAVGERSDAEPIYEGAAWGLGVNSLLAFAQCLGWEPIAAASVPAGFFGNKDFLAESALPVAVWALWRNRWLLIPILPSLVLPQARMVLVIFSIGLIRGLPPFWRPALICMGGVASVVLVQRLLIHDASLSEHLMIWQDTIQGLTWGGRGIGQFYATFPDHATHEAIALWRPFHAHNDYLELLYELGPVGLGLAVAFIVAALVGASGWAVFAFGAVLLDALTAFPFHEPASGVLALLAAGTLWRSRNRDDGWRSAGAVHAGPRTSAD